MKKVLITGSSRGIGAETARLFAKKGCHVYINYNKSEKSALALLGELKDYSVELVKADVSKSDEVKRMFSEISGIDILVNNAGIAQTKLFTDITDDDWNNMISSNLSSAFFCCREALPYMIRQHFGRIINISSMWGQVGASCESIYSASKGAVDAYVKSLAKELGPSNIRVNAVSPGVIRTSMLDVFTEEDLQAAAEDTPLQRLGKPEDVAELVYYLATPAASFITGQVYGVNGGFIV